MRETKYRFVTFSFYDRTGIEAFLEKEAQKGWLLDKIGSFGWRFRKIEPKKLRFSVNYFPKASAFDPEPSEQQVRFQEFCEHTGWKLAGASAQLQIFYNEAEHPVPIETDAALEVATIHKAVKKGYLPSYLILLVCGLIQMQLFVWRFSMNPLGVLCSAPNLFTGFCWIMMLLVVLTEIGGYYHWHRKAKKAAELDGSRIDPKGHRGFLIAVTGIMLIGFASMILTLKTPFGGIIVGFSIIMVFGILFGVLGLSKWMKKMKVSARVNGVVTYISATVFSLVLSGVLIWVVMSNIDAFRNEVTETYEYKGHTYEVYHDELPLYVEDFIEVDYEGYSCEYTGEETFLLGKYEADQRPRLDALEEPGLQYDIIEVKVPFLYQWCKRIVLDEFENSYISAEGEGDQDKAIEIDASAWGAKEAYQLWYWGEMKTKYFVCYENCIIVLDADWEMTKEQMAIVGNVFAKW